MKEKLQGRDTIDLLALARVLLSNWLVIALAMVVFGGVMGVYNKFFVQPSYSAEAQIYISSDAIVSLQEVQLSAALTQDYSNILTSRSVLKKVIADQQLEMDYRELARLVNVSNPQDTHILKIVVTTAKAEESVAIANSLIQFGVDRIFRIVGQESPSVIDYAEMDAVTVNKTSLSKHVMLGALLALVLVCGILTLRFMMDNTIKDESDVRRLTKYNVLAEIPEYQEEEEVRQHGKGK